MATHLAPGEVILDDNVADKVVPVRVGCVDEAKLLPWCCFLYPLSKSLGQLNGGGCVHQDSGCWPLYESAADRGEPFLQRVLTFDPDRRCWRNIDIDLEIMDHGE